jgi:hypothetical protein
MIVTNSPNDVIIVDNPNPSACESNTHHNRYCN